MPGFTVVSSQPFLQPQDLWQGLCKTITILVWIVGVAVLYNTWEAGKEILLKSILEGFLGRACFAQALTCFLDA